MGQAGWMKIEGKKEKKGKGHTTSHDFLPRSSLYLSRILDLVISP